MSLGEFFRRAFGRLSNADSARAEPPPRSADGPSSLDRDQAAAWLAALEAGRLNPPRDVRDPIAWDQYWSNQIDVGAIDQGFADMMSSDPALPGLLARRGAQTILCAGNGLSSEAVSLALHGFHVTALDLSAVAAQALGRALRHPEHKLHRIPGFGIGDDTTLTFACDGPIDADLCPAIHRSADFGPRGGGSLALVTGDLMEPDVCPGPFDVVIERRTVQLFPQDERLSALDRLIGRLAERGTLVSHEHQGRWRPGEPRTHYATAHLRASAFVLRAEADGDQCNAAQRLASLMFSTG